MFGCSIKWEDKREQVAETQTEWAAEAVALQPLELDVVRGAIALGGTVVYRHHGPFNPLALRRAIVDRLGRTYF